MRTTVYFRFVVPAEPSVSFTCNRQTTMPLRKMRNISGTRSPGNWQKQSPRHCASLTVTEVFPELLECVQALLHLYRRSKHPGIMDVRLYQGLHVFEQPTNAEHIPTQYVSTTYIPRAVLIPKQSSKMFLGL